MSLTMRFLLPLGFLLVACTPKPGGVCRSEVTEGRCTFTGPHAFEFSSGGGAPTSGACPGGPAMASGAVVGCRRVVMVEGSCQPLRFVIDGADFANENCH